MIETDKAADSSRQSTTVDAEILMAPGCAHCPGVIDAMNKLTKEGLISQLTIVNIADHPHVADAVGCRGVPWIRIGPYTLEGTHSASELRDWAVHARQGGGMGVYASYLLEQQRLPQVVALVQENPALLHDLVSLLGDLETPMGVRIGIGAVFEDLQDSGLLSSIVDELGALTRDSEAQVRADACHYLGMTGSAAAKAYIQPLMDDIHAEVREIASETLPLLPTT